MQKKASEHAAAKSGETDSFEQRFKAAAYFLDESSPTSRCIRHRVKVWPGDIPVAISVENFSALAALAALLLHD
ncbi:MAG: hypothetical protein H0W63_02105 [Gemmatimonadaceae bacterium]|nr:hypothetical protein [Gemmatimonadaceae bacterium]